MDRDHLTATLRGGLVVSCQAPAGSPLRDTAIIAAVARAVVLGGAVALRVDGPADVAAVRAVTDVPVVGLHKVAGGPRPVITPTPLLARGLVEAGADVVAAEATVETHGPRIDGFGAVVRSIDVPVMADVSTLEEGLRAAELGATYVGTTLSGYTPGTRRAGDGDGPDLELVAALAAEGLTVVAEGRIRSPEQVAAAFDAGAAVVVVGGAITDPLLTARRFVAATPLARGATPLARGAAPAARTAATPRTAAAPAPTTPGGGA